MLALWTETFELYNTDRCNKALIDLRHINQFTNIQIIINYKSLHFYNFTLKGTINIYFCKYKSVLIFPFDISYD